ncbi:MAG: nucleotidyltransferase family protein [Prevotella sp.]|nr:nucleotidyltransferase family protein [Prevotella sp.]MBR1462725.1 nucleotidyltransferase family protein [Prevotella sp.]
MTNYIINNNLFRLLRSGVFNDEEPLEPMSAFKWKRLLQIADVHNVTDYVRIGLQHHKDDPNINIAHPVFDEVLNSANLSAGNNLPELPVFDEQPKMMNFFLNFRLKRIIKEENNNPDSTPETMQLLYMIIHNMNQTLNRGISLKGIVDLGRFLRSEGDRVNFISLETSLNKLGMRKMASLQGSILTTFFHFDRDEIPYMLKEDAAAQKLTQRSLTHTAADTAENWHFRMRTNGMVENNSKVFRRNLRRSIRYMRYNPFETTSNFLNNFAKSLSEIEE